MKVIVLVALIALIGCGGNGTLGGITPIKPIETRKLSFPELEGVFLYGVSNDGRTIAGYASDGTTRRPILMRDFVEADFTDSFEFDAILALSPEGIHAVVYKIVEHGGGQYSVRNYLWRVGTWLGYFMFDGPVSNLRVADTGTVEGQCSSFVGFNFFTFATPNRLYLSPDPPPDPFETPIPVGYSGKFVQGFSASKRAAFGRAMRSDGSMRPCIWLPNSAPNVIAEPPENDHVNCVWASDDGTRALVYVLQEEQSQTYLWTKDRGYISMPELAAKAGASAKDPKYWGLISRSANGRYFVLTHSLHLDEHYWVHVP